MIITMFKGRLGNQMFQYAAARKLALQNNTELKLDLSNMPYKEEYGPKYDNAYGLKFFNIVENIATQEDVNIMRKKDCAYYLRKVFLGRAKRRFVWEKDWLFDECLVNVRNNNMYLRGMFQSEKYFKGIEELIRKEFTLKEPVDDKYKQILERIGNTDSVSIHIRRGDIMVGQVKFEKPVMTIGYYKDAVEYIKKEIWNPHFFVFSDDIEWAKENINFIQSVDFVSQPYMHDYEELYIMSKCKHNIIGNSTFSWWGAWLNNNPNKIVIAPRRWFLDPKKDKIYTDNLLPKSWIKI